MQRTLAEEMHCVRCVHEGVQGLDHGQLPTRARHIHWTRMQLQEQIDAGATATVWKALVDGEERAVKRIMCDVLDLSYIRSLAREVFAL